MGTHASTLAPRKLLDPSALATPTMVYRLAVERNRLAHDVGRTRETLTPQRLGDHRDSRAVGAVVAGHQSPSESCGHSGKGEVASVDDLRHRLEVDVPRAEKHGLQVHRRQRG